MGYHINISTMLHVLDFSKDMNGNIIDRIDVSRDGWVKSWRIEEISDMQTEVGEANVRSIKIIRDYYSDENVLAIEAS